MRTPLVPISLSLALFLLLSCSKGSDTTPTSEARGLVQVEQTASLADAQALADSLTVECENPNACPASVGMLLASDRAGGFSPNSASLGSCTAFLVGSDLAITNSHCIPNAVKLLPELCADRIRLTLPASGGFAEESLRCASLLGSSDRATSISPDLALLRLEKKVARPIYPLNRQGLSPTSRVVTQKIARVPGTTKGRLRVEACLAVANSYRMPIYQSQTSPVIVLGDCNALPGNSGSPIINESGAVVGVMQGDLPISEAAQKEWRPFLDTESDFAKLAIGTSLICLKSNPPDWNWNSACETIPEVAVAEARPRIRQYLDHPELSYQAASVLAPYLNQNNVLGWERTEIETKGLVRRETILPRCFRPAQLWSESFRSSGQLLDNSPLPVRLPTLELSLKLNRFLQVTSPEARLLRESQQTYYFSPANLAREGQGKLDFIDGHQELSITLETCQE